MTGLRVGLRAPMAWVHRRLPPCRCAGHERRLAALRENGRSETAAGCAGLQLASGWHGFGCGVWAKPEGQETTHNGRCCQTGLRYVWG